MTKRPSIIDQAMSKPDAGSVTPTPAAPIQAAPKRKPRDDVQHTSVYIPIPAYDRLREIAFTERCKVHDLLMQGLDRVLADHGHSERATRSTTARQHDSATE